MHVQQELIHQNLSFELLSYANLSSCTTFWFLLRKQQDNLYKELGKQKLICPFLEWDPLGETIFVTRFGEISLTVLMLHCSKILFKESETAENLGAM